MKFSSITAVATFLAVNRVSASEWGTDDCFPVPSNCDNKCTDQQQTGWDWSGLSSGQSVSSYDGFGFSGFTCSDRSSPSSKKRSSDKCISGTISKSGGGYTAPQITCGQDIDAFSITTFTVFVETETDVIFNFGMPDGSNCQFTSRCGTEGTDVHNDQCGGATTVSWSIPDTSSVDSCGFGIYSIGFDCTPNSKPGHSTTAVALGSSSTAKTVLSSVLSETAKTSVPVPTLSTSVSTASASTSHATMAVSTSISTASASTSHATIPVSVVKSQTRSPPAISSAAVSTHSMGSISTIYTTAEVTVTSCASTVTNCPARSHTVITTTMAVSTTVLPAQIGSSSTSSKGSPSSVTSHPNASPSSTSVSNTGSSSSSSSESCPSVVPKCINTWLPSTCNGNTDASCYCPSSNITSSIMSCIQAWSSDNSEISIALSYFTGICSGYIGTNPGIVTAVPTTITLAPTPAQSVVPSGASAIATAVGGATAVPCTTITYSSSTYTVPQVVFTTAIATASSVTTTSIGLVAVTSAPANPNSAAAAAATTTLTRAKSSMPGVAGATGVRTPSSSSTFVPFTGAAIPGASVSAHSVLLSGVMGLLALLL